MDVTVRLCTSLDELADGFAPISHYFGGARLTTEELERVRHVFDYRRTMVAHSGGELVGGCGAHAYELTVPGGTVAAAGVTIVGVQPTHRRRGVLRAMMKAQLEQVHAWHEPVAFLWASEETIYGRFGYGMAALCGDIELPKAECRMARSFTPRGQARFLSEDEARIAIPALYDRIRPDYPGMFSRNEGWWNFRRLADPENRRGGGGVLNRVVLSLDGCDEAYALYRMHHSFDGGIAAGHVNVIEALGRTPEATREIWRFLLDIDWVARLEAHLLPIDHPLFFQLARPRAMKYRAADSLWVRLVDVERALAARRLGEGSSEAITIEVQDELCPWNAGCYRIKNGHVERTDGAPDLSLPVSALGSVYLGGFTFSQLLRAEQIEERTQEGAARADRLFPADRAPWCPEIF